MDIRKEAARRIVNVLTFVLLLSAFGTIARAQEPGDAIYCNTTAYWDHFALYVGPQYDGTGKPLGDATHNWPGEPWSFTTVAELQEMSVNITFVRVPVSDDVRARAVEIAVSQARNPTGEYAQAREGLDYLCNDNCVQGVQRVFLDAGATEAQVGDPKQLQHPSEMTAVFERGQPVDGSGFGGGAGAGGIGSSSGGGIESRPLWLGTSLASRALATRPASSRAQVMSLPVLEQFIPLEAMAGEPGHRVTPENVLGTSNAIDAVGMDYVDVATARIVAAIFGAETINSAYEHDYAVCSRVQNCEMTDLLPVCFNSAWWWLIRTAKTSANCYEVVIPLAIRLDGSHAYVDSRYLVECFPSPIAGTVLNYQIRAQHSLGAIFLLHGILAALAQEYTVSFSNLSKPAQPTVFARTATYRSPNIHLVVDNRGPTRSVRFSGPTWAEPRAQAEKLVEFNVTVPSGVSEVDLPVGPIHDAVIYIEAGGFIDKVYVASGYWFAWDDQASGGTSWVWLETGELQHPAIPGTDSSFVSPPLAEMTGAVTAALSWSHVGMGYTFQQGSEPVDLSAYSHLLFYARGDGKQYRVKLESASVEDGDYHGAPFVAGPAWELVVVPFANLRQEGWGQSVAWTGKDIRTISFVTVGRPHSSIRLAVDRISFGAGRVPVYRFWSPVNKRHFYTTSETEKNKLINNFSHVWTYERIAYYALPTASDEDCRPVYRFWSSPLKAHFYTIRESEKNKLITQFSDVWQYERVAFYAYPEGSEPAGTSPVYRFWSNRLKCHFYTISATERDKLINNFAATWEYESVAWYAYP